MIMYIYICDDDDDDDDDDILYNDYLKTWG